MAATRPEYNRSESKKIYSICMCGTKAVGKTAIFSRVKNIVDNVTSIGIPPFSGTDMVDYSLAGLTENNVIQLFDSPVGMTGNSLITLSNYYRRAACIIFVYDVTNKDTLHELINIYQYIQDQGYCPSAKYVILRNKIDIVGTTQTCISKEEENSYIDCIAPSLCLKLHGSFDISAKENIGIREFFMEHLVEVLQYAKPVKPQAVLLDAAWHDSCC